MTKCKKTLLSTALALAACLTAPVALIACGDKTEGEKGTPELCTVRFDAGNGTIFGDRYFTGTVSKGDKLAEPSEQPVLEDYCFVGWYVSGSTALWDFDNDVVTESDTTLYAKWAHAYTVTFNANGGTFEGNKETYTVTVADGAKVTAPAITPPKADNVLVGWSQYTANDWDFDTDVVKKDISLIARWDLNDETKQALAPFTYQTVGDGYRITSVKDKSVTEIVVPDIVKSIASFAFKDCKSLVSVTIHDGITSIDKNTFENCESLKTVALPADLKSIGHSAFYKCTALEEIDIPDTLRELDGYAFAGCASLKSIKLPVGVTEVNAYTFSGCTSLQEIELGANITEIGSGAFTNCSALEQFTIPSGVSRIMQDTFRNCTSLTSITIPATCEEVINNAFQGCTGLESAEIHAQSIGGSGYASGVFLDCTSLAEVTLGDEVKEIGYGSFMNCSALREIRLPDSVTTVDTNAFKNCTSLRTAVIGNGVSKLSSSMFNGCVMLSDVKLGTGVTELGDYAFQNCYSLLSITIPSSVTKWSGNAFSGCERLVEIYNLSSTKVNGVAQRAAVHTDANDESVIVKQANGLMFCTLNVVIKDVSFLLDYQGESDTVVMPDTYNGGGYEVIELALSYKPQLKSVTIGAGVTGIRNEILLGSDNVQTLVVASGNETYSSSGNCVIETKEKKFILGCKGSVIPEDGSVTTIGSDVFCHNATIENAQFKIPAAVTTVTMGAFDGCDGIIRTSNHVQYVDKWTVGFDYDGDELLDVELDEGTIGIGDGTFYLTRSYSVRLHLRSVKLNAEVKYFGYSAFWGCDKLESVTLNDGLVDIARSAITNCSSLEEIVVPDSVQTIGNWAFRNNPSLKYAKLPEGITAIGDQTFEYCKALKEIVIPSTVKNIGYRVFSECTGLTVYYGGAADDWKFITIQGDENAPVRSAKKYYYSETEQENGWYFGEDGKPTTEY